MPTVQVGPLAEGTGSAWLALVNGGLQNCPGFEPLVGLDYQRALGGGQGDAGLTLAAERGGELVGTVTLNSGGQQGRLRGLVVRPDARRCGIGTALVEAACDRFRRQGLRLAGAEDWDAPSYRAFYRHMRFVPARRYLVLGWDLGGPLPALPVNREVMVRRALLADLEEIADLYAHMYSPYWDWSREGTLEETRERYRAWFARQLGDRGEGEGDRVHLVAVWGGKLVGGITARVDEAYNRARGAARGSLNPGGVGVLSAYRRRGVGSRLLAEALALLRERGMRQATVWTFSYLESEAPAVVLYRRAGARVVRRLLGWERML